MQDIVNSILSETVSGYHQIPDGEKQQFLNRKTDKVISAFKDAGYVSPEAFNEVINARAAFNERWKVMTGAEWLSRFEKELQKVEKWPHTQESSACQTGDVREAAKRAAGMAE